MMKIIKALFLIVCGVMIFAYLRTPTAPVPTPTIAAPAAPITSTLTAAIPQPVAPTLLDNVTLNKVSLQKQDLTFTASFTIENKNTFPIKDVSVTCHHFANSGTEIDQNTRTIYEIVPGNGSKRINAFSMGFIHSQAVKSSCRAAGAKAG